MGIGRFDLDAVCDIISKQGFQRVALQFPDEFLPNCISIYKYITSKLATDCTDIFIIGDSTYGSSIDDISAQHVDSDVLIYFGSDLSSSGSMPVIIVPFSKDVNFKSCFEQIYQKLEQQGIGKTAPTLLLYELSYHRSIHSSDGCSLFKNNSNLAIADIPSSACLSSWDSGKSLCSSSTSQTENYTKVGGLLVPADLLNNPDLVIWYIGQKEEQRISINIRMSENTIVSYSPESDSCDLQKGCESREFRERYGGLLRVKDAQIIGIIVGSMGLRGDITQAIISRLETLITAAKKSSYVFIMGRLNEAKLCNFPEVDIFCLISNEDVALIKPKTFHAPVVTPWEIELGLGGREWQGIFRSDSASILSDVTIEAAVEGVIAALPEDNIDPDSDCEDPHVQVTVTKLSEVTLSSADGGSHAVTDATPQTSSSALTVLNSERSLITFSSPAAGYFNEREFQGLVPTVPEGQDTDIQQGQIGIAKSYKRYEKKVND